MKRLIRDRLTPLVYVITDRRLLPDPASIPALSVLIEFAERALAGGVDMVQIREPDLSIRDLFFVTESIGESARKMSAAVLINDRADIAACTASGVHLATRSLTPEVVRNAFGPDLLIGASTHTFTEAFAAQRGGADFIVFGPVFETESKKQYGDPVGLEALRRVSTSLTIPVLALGGINVFNFRQALDAGAAGVAGISMFTEAHDLSRLVATIKGHRAA